MQNTKKKEKEMKLSSENAFTLNRWFDIFQLSVVLRIVDKQINKHFFSSINRRDSDWKEYPNGFWQKHRDFNGSHWGKTYSELLDSSQVIEDIPYYNFKIGRTDVIISDDIKAILRNPYTKEQIAHFRDLDYFMGLDHAYDKLRLVKIFVDQDLDHDILCLIGKQYEKHDSNTFEKYLYNYFCDNPNPYPIAYNIKKSLCQIDFGKPLPKFVLPIFQTKILVNTFIDTIVKVKDIITYIFIPYFQNPSKNGMIRSINRFKNLLEKEKEKEQIGEINNLFE